MSDAYRLTVEGIALDAWTAARRVFTHVPRWIGGLMALRNCLVGPLSPKASVPGQAASSDWIGFFPMISEMPERVVLGLDDKHLDFPDCLGRDPSRIAPTGHNNDPCAAAQPAGPRLPGRGAAIPSRDRAGDAWSGGIAACWSISLSSFSQRRGL